ncbi:MAG: hypothetical protein EA402_13165, partial [Planctomycetota bacterium]
EILARIQEPTGMSESIELPPPAEDPLGRHRVYPPDAEHPHWRGEAYPPSKGKPTPPLLLRWSWMETEPGVSGLLKVELRRQAETSALSLQLAPLDGVTGEGPWQLHEDDESPSHHWQSEHRLQLDPSAEAAPRVVLTYGDSRLQRSISVPLGWDGEEGMGELPPGTIIEDGLIMIPLPGDEDSP